MYHPNREEFRQRARLGNLVPVYREILADMETPVSAFRKIGDSPYAFLLESVEGGEQVARYSFLGADPFLVFTSKGRGVAVEENGALQIRELKEHEDPLSVLKELMGRYSWAGDDSLPRLAGGAVGYIGYDTVRFFERLPEAAKDDLDLPDCFFVFTDTLLIFDHVRRRIKVLSHAPVNGDPDAAYDRAISRIEALVARLRAPAPPLQTPAPSPEPPEMTSNLTREEFQQAVKQAQEYINAGDAIQVVLSQRLALEARADPFDIYRALRSLNPSPYMFYLSYGDLKLVGSSPEILVTQEKGKVTSRPIAGTRPRGGDSQKDRDLETELLADEKERAEHIMLVDLGRNDLGRVCRPGTVQVDQLMAVERYSHVMHIVSNVVGELARGRDQYDVLRACFPAGTVSGAPKIRAMEIIEELEPTRRGPYAGAMGYFSFSGDMDTCITIRTMVIKEGKAYIQVGAGIVADSVPEREYEETLNKAQALLGALEMAQQGLD